MSPRLTKEQLESIATVYHQYEKDNPEAVTIDIIKRLENKEDLTSEEEQELRYALEWVKKTSPTEYPTDIQLLEQISKGEITLSKEEEETIKHLVKGEESEISISYEAMDDESEDDEPQNWDIPIYKLAKRLRKDKEKGFHKTYKQAYEYGAKHCTIKGQPITAQQLENNYYKANSAGYFDPPD